MDRWQQEIDQIDRLLKERIARGASLSELRELRWRRRQCVQAQRAVERRARRKG